ncbi:hypothetical protein PISL3812_02643 [Talaromyces islandicus]|uniref:RCHY1 zinc-ribbon domain-containing protein n=1 Tax=Talaromyces islandicus TaxID=28573 RepID=A0A0U1LR93_TALIS|nr:hypothetical protein PISL3812_02643 [Talaromyces islandicus]
MAQPAIVTAYRQLYRAGLKAVRYSTPQRHVLRWTLRSAFRSGSPSEFDSNKIAQTILFLERAAASSASLEHKIVKNLLHVRFWEQSIRRPRPSKPPPARPFSSASIVPEASPPGPNLGHDKSDHHNTNHVLQHITSQNDRSAPSTANTTPPPPTTETSSGRGSDAVRHPAADGSSDDVVQLGNMNDQDSHRIHHDDGEGQLESLPANVSLHNSAGDAQSTMTVPPLDRYDRQLHELPEDDGMRVLRRKIHAIRDNNGTSSEKARLIHTLMTESYDSARKNHFRERQVSLPRFPSSLPSLEQSTTTPSSPRPRRSFDQLSLNHAFSGTTASIRKGFNLTPADLEPTYAPRDIVPAANNTTDEPSFESPPIDIGDDNSDYSDENVLILGCEHYKRNVKLQCYTCKKCKSIMNMEARFRNLDRTIESQPMPVEFKDTRAMVYCNDCGAKSDVPYHWLGLKCDLCESYNTAQITMRSGTGEADDEDNGTSRDPTISYNIADHTCESIANSSLVTGPLDAENELWRPSTSHSSDGRSSRGVQRSRPQQMSPAVGNYFDLSRDSAWTPSIFSSRRSEEGSDTEDLGFWATSPLRKYSLFRNRGLSSGDEGESESESASDEDDEEDGIEDDDDDDIDPIELFGHR